MWRRLGLTASIAIPAIVLRLTGTEPSPGLTVLIFGAGVVASAVLLSWAAEAAQVDISGSLAIAILALIAVLPEYAVDLYFSFTAGSDPSYTQFAAANMTGSNRLLIGIGWPLVAFVAFWAMRRRRLQGRATPLPRGPLIVNEARVRQVGADAASIDNAAMTRPLTRQRATAQGKAGALCLVHEMNAIGTPAVPGQPGAVRFDIVDVIEFRDSLVWSKNSYLDATPLAAFMQVPASAGTAH
jgi:hypothetical protein